MANEQEMIDAAARIKAFLADPAVAGALSALDRRYYEMFKTAKTPTERENVWCLVRVLEDFGGALTTAMEKGARAHAERTRREQHRSPVKP